jgi:hypothetical protein
MSKEHPWAKDFSNKIDPKIRAALQKLLRLCVMQKKKTC